jgi:hypothetical protein
MNRFHKYILRWIIKKAVKQGGQCSKIRDIYEILYQEFRKEYHESNKATADHFLKDRLDFVLRNNK